VGGRVCTKGVLEEDFLQPLGSKSSRLKCRGVRQWLEDRGVGGKQSAEPRHPATETGCWAQEQVGINHEAGNVIT